MTVEQTVATLNEFLRLQPDACRAMFAHRVQLDTTPELVHLLPFYVRIDLAKMTLGVLGLLNGIYESEMRIAGCYDEAGLLVGFQARDWRDFKPLDVVHQ